MSPQPDSLSKFHANREKPTYVPGEWVSFARLTDHHKYHARRRWDNLRMNDYLYYISAQYGKQVRAPYVRKPIQ